MSLLNKGDKVGLVACSNPISLSQKERLEELVTELKNLELEVVWSPYIYEGELGLCTEARLKGKALMNFYEDKSIKAIFDVSGGDLANEVLGYLEYDKIKKYSKPFFGYSDLTTVLNTLYSQTGERVYLYQIRNLIGTSREKQKEDFKYTLLEGKTNLYQFDYEFIQGETLEGIVVGGNIRCFLKLAGTPYMPNFKGKVLFLESLGGGPFQMMTYLNQYKQMGVFNEIKGIVLGTFTNMEKEKLEPSIEAIVKKVVDNPFLPIAKTCAIGHGQDSKALVIGDSIKL